MFENTKESLNLEFFMRLPRVNSSCPLATFCFQKLLYIWPDLNQYVTIQSLDN